MIADRRFDAAVIGGGVMGCATALHLARGGMAVALFDKGALCMEASGRNAGTLTPMFPAPFLVPYTMRGIEMWATAGGWLGQEVGFRRKGGIELALTDDEAQSLREHMAPRIAAGAPIEIIGANRARELEPAIADQTRLAAYCPIDGLAASNTSGNAFCRALGAAGVALHEGTRIVRAATDGDGFAIEAGDGRLWRARRLVLAGGAWIPRQLRWFGVELPIACRIHFMVVTERMAPIVNAVVRIVGRGSLKQAANGSFLFGTVLNWISDADREAAEIDLGDYVARTRWTLRNARDAIPAVARARVVRTWTGLEGYADDNMPIVGPVPGVPGAFVIGCQRSGFTAGPFMGRILADLILGREPPLPVLCPELDPARLLGRKLDGNAPAARALA